MARFVRENDPRKADASPTKAFFVDIVTKDVQLDEAIQDLIDNCVDGARRLRPAGDYQGLYVHLELKENEFVIADNCGGIPLEVARHYAFKFGRAAGFQSTDSSVGQFGIGMKRSIFKLGSSFAVSTTEPNARFKIEQDIGVWLADDEHWDFPITELVEQAYELEELGTTVRLPTLAPGVGDRLASNMFRHALITDLRVRQSDAMSKGLEILVNNEAVIANVWRLKMGNGIKPAFHPYDDPISTPNGPAQMRTRLYAGVGASDRHNAGWYVFCNGRCILEADQEGTTGWSDVTEEGVRVPKYHNQFSRFRGFVFLDAVDASILPWNTTKTGLDPESAAYKLIKPRLIAATRPVIDFLNALDKEFDLEPQDRSLNKALDSAPTIALSNLIRNDTFTYEAPAVSGPPMSRITYWKPKAETDKLKDVFGVTKPMDVGLKSFEYSYGTLVED